MDRIQFNNTFLNYFYLIGRIPREFDFDSLKRDRNILVARVSVISTICPDVINIHPWHYEICFGNRNSCCIIAVLSESSVVLFYYHLNHYHPGLSR